MTSHTALQQWALSQLRPILPLDDGELEQLLTSTNHLSNAETANHLESILGDSPQSLYFITSFIERRAEEPHEGKSPKSIRTAADGGSSDSMTSSATTMGNDYKKPSHPISSSSSKQDRKQPPPVADSQPPAYAITPSTQAGASSTSSDRYQHHHTNAIIEASGQRAIDEQYMQQTLQDLQFQFGIYNDDIEPEHEIEGLCSCNIHLYKQKKYNRLWVQKMWAKAVMYPGEKFYSDNPYGTDLFSGNPYRIHIPSPYGNMQAASRWTVQRPIPKYYAQYMRATISLNKRLNLEAQHRVDSHEPKRSIWDEHDVTLSMENTSLGVEKQDSDTQVSSEEQNEASSSSGKRKSRFSTMIKAMGIKSPEERHMTQAKVLRDEILSEEQGRWPSQEWRDITAAYQQKIGMANKVAELRAHSPIQYLHLLRAGYFEPIPVEWARQASNPLKFSVEAAEGWRGITPAWRGFEDLAEERLYWVLNHREGANVARMKPDFISEMDMANARMIRAVEPPPLYFSSDDTCQLQHTGHGYSKQVMPPPFHPYDRPALPTDDTMILLDVSGSMDFNPVRPVTQQYLVTGFERSDQPKNKDVARSIIRRFTSAMEHYDHQNEGYDLVTFANDANYIGKINHVNFKRTWHKVQIGGGTRVMTGWQRVKELHFQKHSESATHHPIYGWQAGPKTPILRLLLLLDGEASDMDEFEMDLLGLSWAHVTIFLIGVDGCPHHHRHANELERISQANHHVSFVDAQGNCPERFVTHELLKRHLGLDILMSQFQEMETPPPYTVG